MNILPAGILPFHIIICLNVILYEIYLDLNSVFPNQQRQLHMYAGRKQECKRLDYT